MAISGPEIITRTMSRPNVVDRHGNSWNYHSRSDRHSKVACWSIIYDLMKASALLRRHVADGHVCFGINHEIRDFQQDRKKDLDLVLCRPAAGSKPSGTFAERARHYNIELTKAEQSELSRLPVLTENSVGSVLIALEAKACMTAHQRALPRLYDELNSSHQTVHGSHDAAIAAGLVMINIAESFLSPDQNKQNRADAPHWSDHLQPKSVEITIDKIRQLPRRSRTGIAGFDAIGILVVDCSNDGRAVRLHKKPPAPQPQDNYHYSGLIDRLNGLYESRYGQI